MRSVLTEDLEVAMLLYAHTHACYCCTESIPEIVTRCS